MYSHEERMTAIKCLIQNRFNYTTTIMELGYPTLTHTHRWNRPDINSISTCTRKKHAEQ